MAKRRAHVIVEGRVQGVFFRYETRSKAHALNLTGWVKNRYDGSVEAVFEGEERDVKKMIEWCHQGPPAAIVRNVSVEWDEPKGEYSSFSVSY